MQHGTAWPNLYLTHPMRFTVYRPQKGRCFQVRGFEWILFHPKLISHLNIFFLCTPHPLSQFLSRKLWALWLGCLLSNFTAWNNHPPVSSPDPSPHSPDLLQMALKSVSSAHPPQYARRVFLKHSHKHVFLPVTNGSKFPLPTTL